MLLIQMSVYSLLQRLTGSRYAPAIFSLITSLLVANQSHAAEKIYLDYGPLGISVKLEELETFAQTGQLDGSLPLLFSRLKPTQKDQLRAALQARYDVDAIVANRFAYTGSGLLFFTELGELFRTESGQNGFYGLRATTSLAPAQSEGMTVLNVLRQFPTDMRINVAQALTIARDFRHLLSSTQTQVRELVAQTEALAAQSPVMDFSNLPDPRQLGDYGTQVQTLTLRDEQRDRNLVVDLYLPSVSQRSGSQARPTSLANRIPVIVISNGLGAHRSRFVELATHLASHGFAVAIPDHPGSDRQRLREFYQGLRSENFESAEYLERPRDVSFLLDELTRLNGERFGDRLNPDQAGIFGYSFGGTTALSLIGAEIDADHLRQDCNSRNSLLNLSLLYQCRALELPQLQPDLKDDRIQATYVFVPFGRSLFGSNGMAQVEGPVFWEATGKDILTPLILEQLPAFVGLTAQDGIGNLGQQPANIAMGEKSSDRYLTVAAGLPHARLTLEVLNRLSGETTEWKDIRPIAQTYHQMLSLTFFQTHLAGNADYAPYLQAQGMQYLTQKPYHLTWQHQSSQILLPSE